MIIERLLIIFIWVILILGRGLNVRTSGVSSPENPMLLIRCNEKNLMVFHIGMETPEMNALIDLNPFGLPQMSRNRQAELKALCSKRFKKVLEKKDVRLITYRQLISEVGLEQMTSPNELDY